MMSPSLEHTPPEVMIGLAIHDPAWRDLNIETDLENFVESLSRSAFLSADYTWLPKQAETIDISIVLTNDDEIKGINAEYRGKDKPTNVLSFPQITPDENLEGVDIPAYMPLGDIILARETIVREASEQGKDLDAHIAHMVVHGTLHLLGYDHMNDSDARIMEGLESDILKTFGFKAPYDDDYNAANGTSTPADGDAGTTGHTDRGDT